MHILMLIIGILFIVNSVRGDSVIMGRILGTDIISSSVANTSMIGGEWLIQRECNILYFLVIDTHTHDITLKST